MINKKTLLAFLLFASVSTLSFSQTGHHKTDVNKDIDVVRVYEQVVREGYGTPYIYEKLANAYYFKNEYNQALSWFEKLFSVVNSTDPDIAYRYKQTLKAVRATNSGIVSGQYGGL